MGAQTPLGILIVDDEAAVRSLVRRHLDDRGFALTEAASGQEALEAASKGGDLGLLITDEMMPGMEGHELARRLRIENPDLKVLYLTGYADRLFKAKRQLWELEAYLDKPFSANGLREAVALLVYGRTKL